MEWNNRLRISFLRLTGRFSRRRKSLVNKVSSLKIEWKRPKISRIYSAATSVVDHLSFKRFLSGEWPLPENSFKEQKRKSVLYAQKILLKKANTNRRKRWEKFRQKSNKLKQLKKKTKDSLIDWLVDTRRRWTRFVQNYRIQKSSCLMKNFCNRQSMHW